MDSPKATSFFDLQHFLSRAASSAQFTKEAIQIKQRQKVVPCTKPGFLINALGPHPPEKGTPLQQIHTEIKDNILPGILNWQSSKFFGYFCSTMSETSLYADMLSSAFNNPAFSYAVSPAHTQLENVVVDWCTEALGLPQKFKRLNSGGGVISSSASNSLFLAVHAAKRLKLEKEGIEPEDPRSLKLVGYVSETAHICSMRALMLKDIHHRRSVPCYFDDKVRNYVVDLKQLEEIIEKDVKDGLIPFFYGASIGTTWSGAIDQVPEISQLCKKYGMWLNIDAAYLGSTWVCEEYRQSQKGIENVDSLIVNFSKLGFIGTGGSLFFVSNKAQFQRSMELNKQFGLYKQEDLESVGIIDYRDWKVDLAKHPTSFRFYFLFRFYGLQKIRQSYRSREKVTKHLERLIAQSKHFQLFSNRAYTLLCFRLKYENSAALTKQLSPKVSDLQEGFITGGPFKEEYILRAVVGSASTTIKQVQDWWSKVSEISEQFLRSKNIVG